MGNSNCGGGGTEAVDGPDAPRYRKGNAEFDVGAAAYAALPAGERKKYAQVSGAGAAATRARPARPRKAGESRRRQTCEPWRWRTRRQ